MLQTDQNPNPVHPTPHAGPPHVVQLREVSARFGSRRDAVLALDAVSLDLAAGTFVAVMGATGSGKSTLLNCAAGLERPSGGSVHLLGHDITAMDEDALSRLRRDAVGFVFQSYNLLSELTVAQNVALPCRLGARYACTVDDVLADVGLAGSGGRPVGTLSGGQRQRVALARALVTGPGVIFADEPTGALDPTTGSQVLALLRRAADDGVAVVMVSHDPGAAAVSDRLVLLRDGRVTGDLATPGEAEIADRLRMAASARELSTVGGVR